MRMNPPREPNTPSGSREHNVELLDYSAPTTFNRWWPNGCRRLGHSDHELLKKVGGNPKLCLCPMPIDHPRSTVSACLARPAKGSCYGNTGYLDAAPHSVPRRLD